jgi:hypothetical protein
VNDSIDSLPDVLREVKSRPLFVMRLEVKPMVSSGAGSLMERRIGVVTGGTFRGERLAGVVMDGGSDWQTIRPDAIVLDVRLVLKTQDDALILMTYRGLRHGSKDVMARLGRAEPVSASEYYFRTQAQFETAAPQYEWLNRVLAIGIGDRRPDGPVYSVFEIL